MRQGRAKKYRKQMNALNRTFKFREPYQVLIDEEIILESVRTKYDLLKGIKSAVQGEIKPMITQCAVESLYKTNNQDAINVAKKFERRRCGHKPLRGEEQQEEEDKKATGTKSAYDCMLEVVNINGKNKHRYVVATNKEGLRRKLKTIPAVPMVFLDRSVMIMEKLSQVTVNAINAVEDAKLTGGLNDVDAAKIIKRARAEEEEEVEDTEEKPKKKRKGPKEPNPLSMKKRNMKKDSAPESEGKSKNRSGAKKRRRKHNRGGDDSNETAQDSVE